MGLCEKSQGPFLLQKIIPAAEGSEPGYFGGVMKTIKEVYFNF